MSPSHVTLQDGGVKAYGLDAGPEKLGLRLAPEHDQLAAWAVPSSSKRLRPLSRSDFFWTEPWTPTAAPALLFLFSAPLTVLTATSEPDVAAELDVPLAPHAKLPGTRTKVTRARLRERFMIGVS